MEKKKAGSSAQLANAKTWCFASLSWNTVMCAAARTLCAQRTASRLRSGRFKNRKTPCDRGHRSIFTEGIGGSSLPCSGKVVAEDFVLHGYVARRGSSPGYFLLLARFLPHHGY